MVLPSLYMSFLSFAMFLNFFGKDTGRSKSILFFSERSLCLLNILRFTKFKPNQKFPLCKHKNFAASSETYPLWPYVWGYINSIYGVKYKFGNTSVKNLLTFSDWKPLNERSNITSTSKIIIFPFVLNYPQKRSSAWIGETCTNYFHIM